MADFSLDLNEDQLQIQKWVHDFAEDVVRPAAPEWDEREETPVADHRGGRQDRPLLAGSSSPTRSATRPGSRSRSSARSCAWGDAGIALAIFGTTLGVSGIVGNGTPEQIAEWVPQCFGTPDEIQLGAFARERARRRLRRVLAAHPRGLRRGQGRVGAQRHQDVDHQRRHRRRARVVASVEPELEGARPRELRRAARARPGLRMGQKFKKMGIRASHTAEVVLDDVPRSRAAACSAARRSSTTRLARAREGQSSRGAGRDEHVRGEPPARRRAGARHRPCRVRVLARLREGAQAFGRPIIENQAIAFKLADMKMEIDAARLLVWRACWMARDGKQFEAGEGSMSKLKAGEVAVKVTEEAIQILGGYGYVREYPVEQWHRDSKIYTIFEGTSEIQRLVIARSISGLHIR